MIEWYYSYSSTDMRLQASQQEGHPSQRDSLTSFDSSRGGASRRPHQGMTSVRLSTTTINTDPFVGAEDDRSRVVSPVETESLQTPPEPLDEFEEPVGPPGLAPECSACGNRLEYMRYVCTVCGEGHFWLENDMTRRAPTLIAAANDDQDSEDSSSSASSGEQTTWAPPRKLSNSNQSQGELLHPLAIVEQEANITNSAPGRSADVGTMQRRPTRDGYELCPACVAVHGIKHTKAMGEIKVDKQGTHRMIQSNVRKLGALNHTYTELLWGAKGWKEIGAQFYSLDSTYQR